MTKSTNRSLSSWVSESASKDLLMWYYIWYIGIPVARRPFDFGALHLRSGWQLPQWIALRTYYEQTPSNPKRTLSSCPWFGVMFSKGILRRTHSVRLLRMTQRGLGWEWIYKKWNCWNIAFYKYINIDHET